MPSYDYECPKCGSVEEVEHSIRDEPEVVCSMCHEKKKRLISKNTTFVLVGDGWAKNGYDKKTSSKTE